MVGPLSCEQCDELLPGYALQALDPDEAAAVAEHLAECTRCPAQLNAYEDALYHLPDILDLHEPPVALGDRLRTLVGQDAIVSTAPRRPTSWRWWSRPVPRWALVLTTTTVLLLASTLWLGWRVWSERQRTGITWQQVVQQLDIQRRALLLLTEPESRRSLLRADGKAAAHGTLLLQPTTAEAVLIVQDLPRLAPGRVYQLWLIRDGVRDNGGTFGVDQDGFGMLVIHAPHPLATYRAAGITEEPSGGSPGPTTPRVIGGKL